MKRIVSIILVLTLICCMIPTAFAASSEATEAADALHNLGLFNGTGTDANGKPIYDLDRAPSRAEAVTMLVRLLGKESEATAGKWETPFTDVQDWAKPYVGYAYVNKLTSGTSATTFGGSSVMTATQYITLVLRALGYESGTDFQWDKAWELSDEIGMTDGRYNAENNTFLRGDVTIISNDALITELKDSKTTLSEVLIKDEAIEEGAALLQGVAPNLRKEAFSIKLSEDGLYVLSLEDLQHSFPSVQSYSHTSRRWLCPTNNSFLTCSSIDEYLEISSHLCDLFGERGSRLIQSSFDPYELEDQMIVLLFSDDFTLYGFFVGEPMLQEDGSYSLDFTICENYDFTDLYEQKLIDYSNVELPFISPENVNACGSIYFIPGEISADYDLMNREEIKKEQLFYMWSILQSDLPIKNCRLTKDINLTGNSINYWRYYLLIAANGQMIGYTLG